MFLLRRYYLLFACLVASTVWGYGYQFIDSRDSAGPTYSWIEPSTHAITIPTACPPFTAQDDGYAGPYDIGFPFHFFDTEYTQFYFNTNGYISFGSGSNLSDFSQFFNPNDFPPGVYYWGADLTVRCTGIQLRYETMSNPTRLVVTVDSIGRFAHEEERVSAQIILFENQQIVIQYRRVVSPGSFSPAISAYFPGFEPLNYTTQHSVEANSAILFYRDYPVLQQPGSGFVVTSNPVLFRWDSVYRATRYVLEIGENWSDIYFVDTTDQLSEIVNVEANPWFDPINNVWTVTPISPIGSSPSYGSFHLCAWLDASDSHSQLPSSFEVNAAYPNPFNSRTSIRIGLPQQKPIDLAVYDITGKEVHRMKAGVLSAGYHSIQFEGKDLPSGTYFIRIQAGEFVQTQKIVLLK